MYLIRSSIPISATEHVHSPITHRCVVVVVVVVVVMVVLMLYILI